MIKLTIELPETIACPLGTGENATGKETIVPVADIAKAHPDVIRFAVINGFLGALNNISRGDLGDEGWAGARQKKVDTWLLGSWGSTERAASGMTLLQAQWLDEFVAKGNSSAKAKSTMAAAVKQVFGEKEKVTFTGFVNAVATLKAKANGTEVDVERDAIIAGLTERAREAAAKRAKASAGIDVTDLF